MNTEDILARLGKTERYFSKSSLTVDKMAAEDLRDAIAEITRLRERISVAQDFVFREFPATIARDGGGVDPPEPVPKPKPDEAASED